MPVVVMPFYPPTLEGYITFLQNQGFPAEAIFVQTPANLAIDSVAAQAALLAEPEALLVAQISAQQLPTQWVTWSYENAIANVYDLIATLIPIDYTLAVYNWAADWLCNWSPDQSGQVFFSGLQQEWNLQTPMTGLVTHAGDQGTESSYAVSKAMQNMTIGSLNQFRTPYGRAYLAIAQSTGTLWGLT